MLFSLLIFWVTCLFAPAGFGQNQPDPVKLSFWTVGSGGTSDRFGPDFYRILDADRNDIENVLLAVAEGPLTTDQIITRSSIARTRVHTLLAELDSVRLITRDEKNRWTSTLPVITDDQMRKIRESLIPLARRIALKLAKEKPRLVVFYDSVRSPTDPPWDDVAHLAIDKFLIDGSFHSAISSGERGRNFLQRYYSQAQRIIPAFFLERGEHFSTFGSNWYSFRSGDGQREVYVLHGAVFKRYTIRMNAHRRDSTLSKALFGLTAVGGIGSLDRSEVQTLRALGWIENERLAVPVVQAKTIKSLLPVLDEIGTGAVDGVFDNFSTFVDAFNRSPYAGFLDGAGDYLQVCYHTLFGLILEQLVNSEVLPAIPQTVPEYFGVYIIMGKVY